MAALGRAALILSFGLVAYALVGGSFAAWKRRRRLAVSAQNALVASFATTLVAALVLWIALARRDLSFVYVAQHTSHSLPLGYALSAFWGGQEGSLLLWLLVLTGYASLAVLLNRRSRDLIAWTVPVLGGIAVFFAFMLCLRLEPVQDRSRSGGRRGDGAEPAEPVHARAPAAALSRLRRPDDPVRVRDGRAPREAHRRTLDRRDATVDARRVDVPRRRAAARRALGVRRDRVGRLLRVGPGRERRAHALARVHCVPALGDDPGEARDAEGVERDARDARVLPLALRDVPHALRRRSTRSTRSRRARSAAGSSASSRSLSSSRSRSSTSVCRCCARGRGSSRSSRARRRSSTTTCCSSRSRSRSCGASSIRS